jgi:hypothetical protein
MNNGIVTEYNRGINNMIAIYSINKVGDKIIVLINTAVATKINGAKVNVMILANALNLSYNNIPLLVNNKISFEVAPRLHLLL